MKFSAWLFVLVGLVMWLGVSACGDGDSGTSGDCPATGATQGCVCPGGVAGAQVCAADGAWGACECTGGGDAGADTPGDDVETDSSSDTDLPDSDLVDAPLDADVVIDADAAAEDAGNDADVAPERNSCGGSTELVFDGSPADPGDSCGSDDAGQLVCDGPDALRCAEEDVELNECGTPGELPVVIGEPCGACGDGAYACTDGGDAACVDASDSNACGGCDALADEPGEPCDLGGSDGTWACSGTEAVTCVGEDRNACGGESELRFDGTPAGPGDVCDAPCGDGVLRCDGADALICNEAASTLPPNACGGCGTLPGVQGAACGECGGGAWACSEIGDMVCEGARAFDACGGCGDLSAELGATCGVCRVWACDDATLLCESTTEGEGCGGTTDPPAAPIGVTATSGTFVDRVDVSWSPVADATGYLVFRDGAPITAAPVSTTTYSDAGAPAGGGLEAPSGVTASTDRTDSVRVTWTDVTPSAGATASYTVVAVNGGAESVASAPATGFRGAPVITAYEVLVRGSWVTATGLAYSDSAAPSATLALTGASASNSREDGVQLSVNEAVVTPGATESYRVRSLTSAGTGAESSTATGRRAAGTLGYAWERAASADGPFTSLVGAAARTFLDTTAAAGVTYAYRATAFATGTDGATSAVVNGTRIASCVELDCGATNQVCTTEGGTARCGACAAGFGDCNSDLDTDGCETPLNTLADCGACGEVCERSGAGETCEAGFCEYTTCEPNFGDCDETESTGCEEPLTTLVDCGGCGIPCELENAAETCSAGSCAIATCDENFADCDLNPATGCEEDIRSDEHCGVCGNACGDGFVCQEGGCVEVPNVQVAVSKAAACTLRNDGDVWCWGALWRANRTPNSTATRPVQIAEIAGATNLRSNAELGDACPFFVAWADDGTAWTIGGHSFIGSAPDCADGSGPEPVVRDFVLPPFTRDVAVSRYGLCVLHGASGQVSCLGSDRAGALGNGEPLTDSVDEYVAVSGLSGVLDIDAGNGHYCAVVADGSVHCWGDNAWWQVTGETGTSAAAPVRVEGVPASVRVVAGEHWSCGLSAEGELTCWGDANPSAMTINESAPHLIATDVAASTGGGNARCVLFGGGDTVGCQGFVHAGRFGRGADGSLPLSSPALRWTGEPASDVFDVAANENLICIVAGADGEIWCAGVGSGMADGQAFARSTFPGRTETSFGPGDRWRLIPIAGFGPVVTEEGSCRNGIDDDGDGDMDLDDVDCALDLGSGPGPFNVEVSPLVGTFYARDLPSLACFANETSSNGAFLEIMRTVIWTAPDAGTYAVSYGGADGRPSAIHAARGTGEFVHCGNSSLEIRDRLVAAEGERFEFVFAEKFAHGLAQVHQMTVSFTRVDP